MIASELCFVDPNGNYIYHTYKYLYTVYKEHEGTIYTFYCIYCLKRVQE